MNLTAVYVGVYLKKNVFFNFSLFTLWLVHTNAICMTWYSNMEFKFNVTQTVIKDEPQTAVFKDPVRTAL